MIEVILKPIKYLKIKSSDNTKQKVDIYIPLFIGVILSIILSHLYYTSDINIFKNSSLSTNIMSFIQTLPGFYIASLAAIVSFNNVSLDYEIKQPTMFFQHEHYEEKLTRRRFLCYMLSYLAFASLGLCLLIITLNFIHSLDKILCPYNSFLYSFIYFILNTLIFFLLCQIIMLTCVCLWYLGERVHFNDLD